MKPFDLEAAKRGEPIMQRNKMPAELLRWDLSGDFPLLLLITSPDGLKMAATRRCTGHYRLNGSEHECDLVMAPRKEKRWIVSWTRVGGPFNATGFDDKQQAEDYIRTFRPTERTNVQIHETEVEL